MYPHEKAREGFSRKPSLFVLCRLVVVLMALATPTLSDTHYVSPLGKHVYPFSTWELAATNIQSAINASVKGDTVLVTNGVYETGSVVVDGATNRIALLKAITVRSVNGARHTTIKGGGSEKEPVRCAYLSSGSKLVGFTLSHGFTAKNGGGAACESQHALLQSCIIKQNEAKLQGGGVFQGTVRNCTLLSNTGEEGGGTYSSRVESCTIVGNSAHENGGGTMRGFAVNSIIYFNEAKREGNNWWSMQETADTISTWLFCCTTPEPPGIGNITNPPGIVGLATPLLLPTSPCVDRGENQRWMKTATDLDGSPRLVNSRVDMGSYEFTLERSSVPLSAAIHRDVSHQVATGFTLDFQAEIEGGAELFSWDWGDGSSSTNVARTGHTFDQEGDYNVVLTVWGGGDSVSTTTSVSIASTFTNYVSKQGSHTPPYTNWVTAATNIQSAITANGQMGGVVMVDDGTYDTGSTVVEGGLPNRIAVTNALSVVSRNGPEVTRIVGRKSDEANEDGPHAIRCAYLGPRSRLIGFTLTDGHTHSSGSGERKRGGGVWAASRTAMMSNLVVSGNSAEIEGGGVVGGTVYRSRIIGNRVGDGTFGFGGGAARSVLIGCEVISNTSKNAGGVSGGEMYGCMVSNNFASAAGGGAYRSVVYDSQVISNRAEIDGGGIFRGRMVSQSSIRKNIAGRSGGGCYTSMGIGFIKDSELLENQARRGGGFSGVQSLGIFGSLIKGNTASERGGGIYRGIARNCIVVGNEAHTGGGVHSSVVESCTLVGNHAREAGGGSGNSTNINSIIYYNTSDGPERHKKDVSVGPGHIVSYCCTPLNPFSIDSIAGAGHVSDPPSFVDRLAGDYRLEADSPCIDQGVSQNWMFQGATDKAGEPRILNDSPDIGAHEFSFSGTFQALLQGAYSTAHRSMRTDLVEQELVPRQSPYASDRRFADRIPSNAVDWIHLQLRREPDGPSIVSQSLFLRDDGSVITDNGRTSVRIEASTAHTSYYVVLQHRNHVSLMSAEPVAFTNRLVGFDFTESGAALWGGETGAVKLTETRWGMAAGDADGDGEVRLADVKLREQQTQAYRGKNGYYRSDYNLDGVVSNQDPVLFDTVNKDKETEIAHPEVLLSPSLSMFPERLTLRQQESQLLTVEGSRGVLSWTFVENASGGTLSASEGDEVIYKSGPSAASVDVIQAWDEEGALGRSFMNVISDKEVGAVGKAVVVAGGQRLDDPVWAATDFLADKAYRVLRYLAFAKEHIEYLSFDPDQADDVDGNGVVDDIDGYASMTNLEEAFTRGVGSAERLFVYLADHGSVTSSSDGAFRLNNTQLLRASVLDGWLDDLQDTHTKLHISVVMDFCYAGSFLDELAYDEPARRVLIASTTADQLTYFIAGGRVSFSDIFFSALVQREDLQKSFEIARSAMSTYQSAQIKGNGAGIEIGATFVAGKDIPVVGSVAGPHRLEEGSSARLWAADIHSFYPIERVWCSVRSPSHAPDENSGVPVVNVEQIDLLWNPKTARYEAEFDGFTEPGEYKVVYYVQDIWNSTSSPKQSSVIQVGFDERIVLVAAGSTRDDDWVSTEAMARTAYATFQSRLFDHDSIYFLSAGDLDVDGDGSNDVDARPGEDELEEAIASWARDTDREGIGADRLTIYIIGDENDNKLRLNEFGESLDPVELAEWIDRFQLSDQAVNVVLDFPGAGSYIPLLSPSAGKDRVLVASTGPNRERLNKNRGTISFTQFLMSELFNGTTLGESVDRARKTIRRASGKLRQRVEIDDDGDGRSNEKNEDGIIARQRFIGPAFLTGADSPLIGEVVPPTVITNATALTLWASDVTDIDGIARVWCLITEPDYYGVGDLIPLDLVFNPGLDRYETLFDGFTMPGRYVVTFLAEDKLGERSCPVQSEVLRVEALAHQADEYEPDNTRAEATLLEGGGAQTHTLDHADDVDWVRFYALSNLVYDIETLHLSTNVDTVLEVFYEQADGELLEVDRVDEFGVEEGELTGLDFPAEGFYYVVVSPFSSNGWAGASSYQLVIDVPAGGAVLLVEAIDVSRESVARALPEGSKILLDGIEYMGSDGNGVLNGHNTHVDVQLDGEEGSLSTHIIEVVSLQGYLPVQNPGIPGGGVGSLTDAFFANPRSTGQVKIENGWKGSMTFAFKPHFAVEGSVRDAGSNEPLEGAGLTFTGLNGNKKDLAYTSYPFGATYERAYWVSDAQGAFPTNLFLPPVDWELEVHKIGYELMTTTVTNPGIGEWVSLGEILLKKSDNTPPTVEAGTNRTVVLVEDKADLVLSGVVRDDGAPDPPGLVTSRWTQVRGPVEALLEFADEHDVRVTLTEVGSYVFRLTAYDGIASAFDELIVEVEEEVRPQGPLLHTRTPVFAWNSIAGARTYRLWLRRNGEDIDTGVWVEEGTEYVRDEELPCGQYEWWVRGATEEREEIGDWMGYDFEIECCDSEGPGQVALVSPSATITKTTESYRWTADACSTHYELLVYKDRAEWLNTWIRTGLQTGVVSYATSDHELGSYTWWVRGWTPDPVDTPFGPWSEPTEFNFGKLSVLSPTGAVSIAETLSWKDLAVDGSEFPNISNYHLWINRGGSTLWNEIVAADQTVLNQDTRTYVLPLVLGLGEYTWWVRPAADTDQLGPWSAAAMFDLGKVQPLEPETNMLGELELRWDDRRALNSTWYQLWMNKDGVFHWNAWVMKNETMVDGPTRYYGFG